MVTLIEEHTDISQSKQEEIVVSNQDYTIKFMDINTPFFRPGQQYDAFVSNILIVIPSNWSQIKKKFQNYDQSDSFDDIHLNIFCKQKFYLRRPKYFSA